MPKWDHGKPYTVPPGGKKYKDGARVMQGQEVPPELVTPSLFGAHLGKLTALTQDDMAMYEIWKKQNPRIAWRWAHLENSPDEWSRKRLSLADDAAALAGS